MTARTSGGPGPAALLRALADLHINDTHVEIVEGCVHLHGVATCYEQKRLAGELAARVTGLPVTNEMRVALSDRAEDEHVMQEAARALARLGSDIAERVRIDVRDGVVSVHGTARHAQERDAIARAVTDVPCVARVENRLVLQTEMAPDAEVAQALNAYIERAMNLPRGSIVVDFEHGLASLSGSVPSVAHRQAIEELVRWHDGVIDVINKLRVAPATGIRAGAHKAL